MNARISLYWQNTKALPLLLRVLIQGAMVVTPMFLLLLVLPISEWEVDGRLVSYAELWSSGQGFAFAVSLLLVGTGAWGLAARNAQSRWLLVLSAVAPYFIVAAFPASGAEPISFAGVVSSVVTAAIFYVGLFRIRSVQEYLALKVAERE